MSFLNLGLEALLDESSNTFIDPVEIEREYLNSTGEVRDAFYTLKEYVNGYENLIVVKKAVAKYGATESLVALVGTDVDLSVEGLGSMLKTMFLKIWTALCNLCNKIGNFIKSLGGRWKDAKLKAALLKAKIKEKAANWKKSKGTEAIESDEPTDSNKFTILLKASDVFGARMLKTRIANVKNEAKLLTPTDMSSDAIAKAYYAVIIDKYEKAYPAIGPNSDTSVSETELYEMIDTATNGLQVLLKQAATLDSELQKKQTEYKPLFIKINEKNSKLPDISLTTEQLATFKDEMMAKRIELGCIQLLANVCREFMDTIATATNNAD